jgi:phosphoesterase RecJ-like protein
MHSNTSLEDIASELKSRNRFLVLSHFRPDGDAIGCALAMGLCLLELGKDVTVWNEDGMLEKYSYLPHADWVERPPAAAVDFEVAIALDTAVQSRVGTCFNAVGRADQWINIDHHVSNDCYGDLAYVDATAPATGQILFELFSQNELPLTAAMADNLFVAISTDTGSFHYPSTTARTCLFGATEKRGARAACAVAGPSANR